MLPPTNILIQNGQDDDDDDDDDGDDDDDEDDDDDDDDIFLLLLAHPTPDTTKFNHPPTSLSDVGRKTNQGKTWTG